MKKGVDEESTSVLYYDSRADEAVKAEKNAGSLISRRMYPENYTMQNMLDSNLTSQMQHR